jgi:hypothetical protein
MTDLKDFIQVLKRINELVYVKTTRTHVNAVMVVTKLKELVRYENVTNKN